MRITEFCLVSASLLVSEFVFVHGASGGPDDIRKLTAGVRKKCLAETKTTIQAVEDTENGNFPEDDKLKCYFKCALEKTSMMDKNGKIKYNLLKKIVPEQFKEVGYEMIDSCTDVTGKNNCDKAYNFMKCMFYVNPLAFIAP